MTAAALGYLRKGAVDRAKTVLIRGASGSIGTFAVQLAKRAGAHVTAVCPTQSVARVASIGADVVIDYTKADFETNGERYDLILDVVGKMSIWRCLRSLSAGGRYVRGTVPGLWELLVALWIRLTRRKRVIIGDAGDSKEDLVFLGGLMQAGELEAVIDRRYPLDQIAEAHRYVGQGHKQGQPISHHEGITIMSGYNYVPSNAGGFASDWGGPTIDQVIADIIADQVSTPIRSLQVGTTKYDSPIDNGTAAKAASARGVPGALTPLFPEQNPRLVWQSVFGEFHAPASDGELRLSVLDSVNADIAALKGKLGAQDNVRLDAHLQHVAELENKIAALPPSCQLPDEPTHENTEANGQEQLTLVNQIMSDLIAYAFVCDITRVASNLFCSVASEAFLSADVGTSSTIHGHSHANDEGYNQNIQFIMGCISTLMQTLAATEDLGGESLLESTLVFASSEMSQGYTHSWQRTPMIIGGHGRGHLRHPGVHYRAIAQNSPSDDQTAAGNTTDVLLALARAFDPSIASVGAGPMISTTPLAAILA